MTDKAAEAADNKYIAATWMILEGGRVGHYFRYRGEYDKDGYCKAISLCGIHIRGTPNNISQGFGRYDADCHSCINRMMKNKSLVKEMEEWTGESDD
jgi:hypothetical protein